MNCRQARRFILTDYLDGQVGGAQKARIEMHLAHCQSCRSYLQEVKEAAAGPFAGAKSEIVPPPGVWRSIRESLAVPAERKAAFGIFGKISFPLPKTSFAVMAAMLVVIVVGFLVNSRMVGRKNTNNVVDREIEYLTYSVEAASYNLWNNIGDFGTLVEEFFL